MKIALYGATGNIGQRILNEALSRNHQVTAIVRDPKKITVQNNNLTIVTGNIMDIDDVSGKVKNNDVVISAYGPGHSNPQLLINATRSLIDGVKKAGVNHLVVVGVAGSLDVAPGLQLMNTPTFPEAWKATAFAHSEALRLYKSEKELDWSYISPAAIIEPEKRTGVFRTSGNQLITDNEGNSKISMEDFAVAVVNEAEKPEHIQKQFTVAY